MLVVEQWAELRRLHFIERVSVREAQPQFPDVPHDLAALKQLKQLGEREIPLEVLRKSCVEAIGCGVAYEMAYRSEFEELWHRTFETLEPDWSLMRSYGLAIPERQELRPLVTAEADTLNLTAAYVRSFRPELLEPLNLGNYGRE